MLSRRTRYRIFSITLWKQRLMFLGGAIVVGLVAAGFAIACERFQHIFDRVLVTSRFLPLLVTPLGFMLCAFMAKRFFPGSQGSGIPQVVAARQSRDIDVRTKLVSLKIAFGKLLLTPLGIMFGASIGREGPTVQVGAAIMLASGKFFGRSQQHGLILAGGAAGIAAAFNTPLAGIVFAIEELSRAYERRTNSLVLTAIIFAGISAMAILGNYTYFGTMRAGIDTYAWPAVIVCGLAGGLFSRFIIAALSFRLPWGISTQMKNHPYWFAGSCGLAIAIMGVCSHNIVYGSGYSAARNLIEGGASVSSFFGVLKFLATALSSISGIAGGFFAPSLATGAGLGANIASLFPGLSPAVLVMLGMVAYFSGIVQAPITAFVIVFEMTNNHGMIVPIMAAALIASITSKLVCPSPIYHTLAENALRQIRPPASS